MLEPYKYNISYLIGYTVFGNRNVKPRSLHARIPTEHDMPPQTLELVVMIVAGGIDLVSKYIGTNPVALMMLNNTETFQIL